MSGPSLTHFLASLEAAGSRYSHRGNHVQAVCPAHDDRDPSLSIDWKPAGRVLVNCQAACKTADVLAALGLAWADLYDQPRERGWQPIRRAAPDPLAELRRVLDRAVRMINAKAAQRHWRATSPPWPDLHAGQRIALAEWGEKQDQDAHYWRTVARRHFEGES